MWRNVKIGFLGVAAVLVLVICGVSGYERVEIDLNAAQLRTTRYIFFEIPVSRQVTPTGLSRLAEKYSLAKSPPRWYSARRTPSGIYSLTWPHSGSRYEGVVLFMKLFYEYVKELDDEPGRQREIVAEIMGYLQSDDSRAADRRIQEIMQELIHKRRAQAPDSATTETKP